jgi:hypothetical protein
MRLVNRVEKEVLRSEWENWLMDETSRCEQVGMALSSVSTSETSSSSRVKAQLMQKVLNRGGSERGDESNKKQAERQESLRHWYDEYCGSCRIDHDKLMRERDGEGLSMASI